MPSKNPVLDKPLADGEKRIRPDVLLLTLLDDIRISLVGIVRYLAAESFEGEEDPRNSLSVTDEVATIDLIHYLPHKPWIAASFTNYGSDTVYVAINIPTREIEVRVNETVEIDREHAKKRIEYIFYRCAVGGTATMRIVGQY